MISFRDCSSWAKRSLLGCQDGGRGWLGVKAYEHKVSFRGDEVATNGLNASESHTLKLGPRESKSVYTGEASSELNRWPRTGGNLCQLHLRPAALEYMANCRAAEGSQQLRLTLKPNALGLIHRTHIVKGENQFLQIVF